MELEVYYKVYIIITNIEQIYFVMITSELFDKVQIEVIRIT